jgi:hypothetical protein
MQRMQQDHAASMAKLQTQLTDQLRDHQMWWTSTAKDQAAGDPIGDEAAIARAKATAMNAAAANASANKAAAARAEEAMENVQVQVTQVY